MVDGYMSNMIKILLILVVVEGEIELQVICVQGSGGQNVNKVSSVIYLCFDIYNLFLFDFIKQKLFKCNDSWVNFDGVMIIKV